MKKLVYLALMIFIAFILWGTESQYREYMVGGFLLVAFVMFYLFFCREEEVVTASGKVMTKKDNLFSSQTPVAEEKEVEENPADEFASYMKDLFDALVSVGFSAEQALTLMETSISELDEYDTVEEFAGDLWEIFNSLKRNNFTEEQAIHLVPLYWEN